MAGVYRGTGAAQLVFFPDGSGKSDGSMQFANGVLIHMNGHENEQLKDIILEHLPDMLELFIKKNSEYGAGDPTSGTMLGVKGQFADIWRKIGKLKTALWDGKEDQLTTESVEEILRDLIGHCFLALHMRAQDRRPTPQQEIESLRAANESLRAKLAHWEGTNDIRDWPGRSQAVARSERSDSDQPNPQPGSTDEEPMGDGDGWG